MTAQQRVKWLLYLCKAVRAASRNQNDETREGFTKVPVLIFLLFKLTLNLQENSPIFLFFFFFFTNLDLNNYQISSDCFLEWTQIWLRCFAMTLNGPSCSKPLQWNWIEIILQRRVGQISSTAMRETHCQLLQTLDCRSCCQGWYNQLLV